MTEMSVTPIDKEVVVTINGVEVVRTTRAVSLKEGAYNPITYFPPDDVNMSVLTESEKTSVCPHKGTARYWNVDADGKATENGAWAYDDPKAQAAGIDGYIAFYPFLCKTTET